MQITPQVLEQMIATGKSLAHWAQVLGRTEVSLAVELQVIATEQRGLQLGNMALRAMQITQAAEAAGAGGAAVAGAGVAGGGGGSTVALWALRIAIGGALVLGIMLACYLAYRIYTNWNSDDAAPTVASAGGPLKLDTPATSGPYSTDGPLTGEIGGTTVETAPPPATPGRIEEVREQAKREFIPLPDGVGTEELIKGGAPTAVSGGAISQDVMARRMEWTQRINEHLEDLYHHGSFDGFGDTWMNILKWQPYPAVVKAELKQEGSTVTGFLWITVADHPDGFMTRKVAVTRGVATGSRGFEDLQIELADGQIRGTLYLLHNGAVIEGDLNGYYVNLSGGRVSEAREALEERYPMPN